MRIIISFLLGVGLLLLTAGMVEWVNLGNLIDNLLPVMIGFLSLILVRLSEAPNPFASPKSLRLALMRNVISKIDDHPPVTLDIKKGFFSRPRGR
jgi:hypothetical protein